MKAVIMAGGKGTRLEPYTKNVPKPLLTIGDQAIVDIVIQQLRRSGVGRVTMAVGHRAELIQLHIGNGSRYGLEIEYHREGNPLGTAGPLALIQGLSETFIVANGDILTTLDFSELVRTHRESGSCVTVAVQPRTTSIDLGVVELDGGNRVIAYREKPETPYLVGMGVYAVEPRAIGVMEPGRPMEFPDLINILIARGEKVGAYSFDGYWRDLGSIGEYEAAKSEFPGMVGRFLPSAD